MKADYSGIYRICDTVIRITSIYENIHQYCSEYKIEEKRITGTVIPDLEIVIQLEEIEFERIQCEKMTVHEHLDISNWSEPYLEELAVYRKISEWMPAHRNAFLFHGSVVAVDGIAYAFAAPSGTGKSTHARLWRELLGERAVMVNDDKPLIRVSENGTAIAYGTPWNGKHHLSTNISVPLKAICFLKRSDTNHITSVEKKQIFPLLMNQVYRPSDPSALICTMRLLDRLNVSFWQLKCNMDLDAAKLSYETMSCNWQQDKG